ncbi:MAG: class I SAM-dependent methyltransferase [Acidimicrobiales bacterium]
MPGQPPAAPGSTREATLPSRAHRQAWQDWGAVNPLFSILTDPRWRHGGDVDEFLATGEGTVAQLMAEVDRLGLGRERRAALDFGCGVGRLTAPLARRFDQAVGVDVAESMLVTARRLHASVPNCRFVRNDTDDLSRYADTSFDLVVRLFVLQHLDSDRAIETLLAELVRVLAPGGALVVNLCSAVAPPTPPLPLATRAGLRARAAAGLRRAGVPPGVLYRALDWTPPMTMRPITEARARAVLEAAGGRIAHMGEPEGDRGGTVHHFFYVTS